jgi:hypothetical protein
MTPFSDEHFINFENALVFHVTWGFGLVLVAGLARVQACIGIPKSGDSGYPEIELT